MGNFIFKKRYLTTMFKFILLALFASTAAADEAKCIADLESLVTDGEAIIADIKKGDPKSLLDALTQLEAVVKVIDSLKADCTTKVEIPMIGPLPTKEEL